MIRVHKPEQAPLVLRERGAALTTELCRKVEAGESPSFDRGVYGAAEVKLALSAAQHDKCCFCESKLRHAQFGDVEHFRPKASAQQSPDATPTTGYYWLAYAWENLYLSCEVCNRRHKRDLFPLLNPDRRITSHRRSGELVAEQPVFIDPGTEDPMVLSSSAETWRPRSTAIRVEPRRSRPFSSTAMPCGSAAGSAASCCLPA